MITQYSQISIGDGKFWFALMMTATLAINFLRAQKNAAEGGN